MVRNPPAGGLTPWSWKIPHALGQLSLCATTVESVPWRPCSAIRKAPAMRSPHAATREQPRQPQPGKAQAQQPRHSQSNQIKTRIKQGRILNILPVGINQLESRTADDAMSTFGKDSENIYTHTHSREKTLSNRETQNQILKAMSIELVMPSNHLIVCRPLLPSIFPSIRVFSSESALHISWPKDWSFIFSINPSHEYSQLISF